MQKELRDKWVAELRSGRYTQGSGALRAPSENGDRFCCLGVLCDIVDGNKWGSITTTSDDDRALDAYEYEHSAGLPPLDFLKGVGLDLELAYDLSTQNDDGASFREIADYIERWLS